MTAPSLSIPADTLGVVRQQVRAVLSPRALAGAGIVLGVALVSQLLGSGGRPILDPTVALVAAIAAAALVAGLRGGLLAAALAIGYGALVLSQPPFVDEPGNGLRVLVFAAGGLIVAALVGSQRDRLDRIAGGAGSARGMVGRARLFGDALTEAQPEALATTIVSRAVALVGADMGALTVLDVRSGRHLVRAVHGTSAAAVGVEVLPGVGLAGQVIRDHRVIVLGRAEQPPAGGPLIARLVRWLDGQAVAAPGPAGARVPPAIALPLLQAGSVVATLTVGRANPVRPFTDDERRLLEVVAPQIALAVANAQLRGQLQEASLKDALTGLYNRSYLDAALDQMLALRRRTPPEARPPLSLILFDIDNFRRLMEQHGPPVGDHVLRAVAALLRQRFRASDTVARVGGDGFMVVMDGADLKAAVEAAGQIRSQLREMSLTDERGAPLPVSISAGCAMFRDDVARSEQVYRTVEAALDTARWSGPGAVVAI